MAARIKRWEKAVVEVFGDSETPADLAVYNLAGELDSLERRMVEEARSMAESLERQALLMERGESFALVAPVMQSAALMEARGRYEAKRDALGALLAVAFPEKRDAFFAAMGKK